MARRRLKFPLSLAFAVVSAGTATVSCGSNAAPSPDAPPPPMADAAPVDAEPDAPTIDAPTIDTGPAADAHSALFCVPDGTGTGDAGGCPVYADQNNECPPGCEPVS